MKYSEFNHYWSDMELQYLEGEIFIYCDGVIIGKVSKEYRYMMSTHYAGFEELPLPVAVKLFADMAMLAETPLAEREEEKRYWLQKIPVPLLDKEGEKKWLWKYTGTAPSNVFGVDTTKIDSKPYKTIFTESEIAKMDITGFQKVEVSND